MPVGDGGERVMSKVTGVRLAYLARGDNNHARLRAHAALSIIFDNN